MVDPRRQQILRIIGPNGSNLTVSPRVSRSLVPFLAVGRCVSLHRPSLLCGSQHQNHTWDDLDCPRVSTRTCLSTSVTSVVSSSTSEVSLRCDPSRVSATSRSAVPHIFEDSYAEIMRQQPKILRRLMIKFDGEDGLDYGGLRESSSSLSHEMFNNPSTVSSSTVLTTTTPLQITLTRASTRASQLLQVYRTCSWSCHLPPTILGCLLYRLVLQDDLEEEDYAQRSRVGGCRLPPIASMDAQQQHRGYRRRDLYCC